MFMSQEIYYITTGNYKHRKSCYLIYNFQSGHTPVRQVLTREQHERFYNEVKGNLTNLPILNVTPAQYKEYEKQLKY